MNIPIVDLSTIYGVESNFRKQRDPWARRLAGEFADFFIYSEAVRYILPTPIRLIQLHELPQRPQFILDLEKHDSQSLRPEIHPSADKRFLAEEFLLPAFENFYAWGINNRETLAKFVNVHSQVWVREGHRSRVEKDYYFSVLTLTRFPIFGESVHRLNLPPEEILYAFDLVLRYPVYGELAGEDTFYFAHPVREAVKLPTKSVDSRKSVSIPVRFRDSVISVVDRMDQEDFSLLLHAIRSWVRENRIDKLKHGQVEKGRIREMAFDLGLPAHLRAVTKVAGVAGGIIAGLAAVPILGAPATIVGAGISVASALWKGKVPQALTRVKWLQWAWECDLEAEAEPRSDS